MEKTRIKCDWKQLDENVSDEEFNMPFEASMNFLRIAYMKLINLTN